MTAVWELRVLFEEKMFINLAPSVNRHALQQGQGGSYADHESVTAGSTCSGLDSTGDASHLRCQQPTNQCCYVNSMHTSQTVRCTDSWFENSVAKSNVRAKMVAAERPVTISTVRGEAQRSCLRKATPEQKASCALQMWCIPSPFPAFEEGAGSIPAPDTTPKCDM